MKSKKKGKPAGKRGIKDFPVSDAKAKNAKGGGSVSGVINSIGNALGRAARGGGSSGGYTQDEMAQDLK